MSLEIPRNTQKINSGNLESPYTDRIINLSDKCRTLVSPGDQKISKSFIDSIIESADRPNIGGDSSHSPDQLLKPIEDFVEAVLKLKKLIATQSMADM